MGKQKKTRKYATMKRMLSLRDQRLKEKDRLKPKKKEKKDPSALKEREVWAHLTTSSLIPTLSTFP
ncbi:FCF1 isoform 3 [Pan troglodytes]|uniref:FCF1 rRNA-processing protein n=2 Tax=Homininae TaxID=207598 RepID=G3V3N8_HUMAN|nr:FCF1 rRNA-processing protein [Homo sapiens]KAI4061655.1 FCF1 rRNA-processing protein [Homo sapiens]PNI84269.1 FCF1 isoform 3 [Pan troglodytes]